MKDVPLSKFYNELMSRKLHVIFEDLERAKTEFYGDDVIVYLPKFSIESDFTLNVILEKVIYIYY